MGFLDNNNVDEIAGWEPVEYALLTHLVTTLLMLVYQQSHDVYDYSTIFQINFSLGSVQTVYRNLFYRDYKSGMFAFSVRIFFLFNVLSI